MKSWKHNPTDTKRVKLLKNCASKIHEEIVSSASKPLRELHEQLLIADLNRLNARIKRAEGERAKALQVQLDFSKRQRARKKMTRKLYVKVK